MIEQLRTQLLRIVFILSAGYFVGHSAAALGIGMWGIALVIVVIPIGISLFVPAFEGVAQSIEVVVSTLACFALALGLVAATIGGSFTISTSVRPVYYALAALIVSGFADVWLRRRKARREP